MFDSFKTTSRRLFGALISVVSVLFGAVRWVLRGLFGQWQPPLWLKALGNGLANVGHKARAYPRQAAGGVLGLVLLAAAGFYGWHWYSNLPQPHTVGYSLHKPNLTDYTQQPPVVDNLQIRFAESAAPLEGIGKTVTQGIVIKPAVQGTWRWTDDHTLLFVPEKDWPIDTGYSIDISKKGLLAGGVLLDHYNAQFSTQPFRAKLAQNELYQDPVNPTLKQLVATFRFSHPVDEDSLRKRVSVTLGKGLAYRDAQLPNLPEITFDDAKLNAYVRSAALATPLESTPVSAKIDEGIKARDGGNASSAPLQAEVTVPGRYRLTFTGAEVSFVDNERGEPEPVLMFSSSSAVADETIATKVQAWLLPEKAQDDTQPWNTTTSTTNCWPAVRPSS